MSSQESEIPRPYSLPEIGIRARRVFARSDDRDVRDLAKVIDDLCLTILVELDRLQEDE